MTCGRSVVISRYSNNKKQIRDNENKNKIMTTKIKTKQIHDNKKTKNKKQIRDNKNKRNSYMQQSK